MQRPALAPHLHLQVPMMVVEQQLKARAGLAGLSIPTWAAIPLASLSLQARQPGLGLLASRCMQTHTANTCSFSSATVRAHRLPSCPSEATADLRATCSQQYTALCASLVRRKRDCAAALCVIRP